MIIIEQTPEVVKFKASNTDDIIVIDAEDLDRILKINEKWCVARNVYGDITSVSSRRPGGFKVVLSRIIANCKYEDRFLDIDHKDRDKLNNRKKNLQKVSHQLNCHRTGKHRVADATSIYKGVRFRKDRGKWEARIRIGEGVRISLGHYEEEVDAALAYNLAALKYYRTQAVLNKIQWPKNPQGLKEVKV